jgi:hypothetical protein
LALFVFGVAANHPHRAFTADDLAVLADAFDAGSYFHVFIALGANHLYFKKTQDQYCSTTV